MNGRLNPDTAAIMRATAGAPALGSLPPSEMRRAYSAGRAMVQPAALALHEVQDDILPGPAGPIPIRLYRAEPATAPGPALLYLHGGGWVLGDLASHDVLCRRLAAVSGGLVIAVDYRLAPEHPFPAAIDDAAAALAWLAAHAARLRVDPARIAVGGDSAGGNLAAVLALMARDGGLPRPMFQLLLYPVTDLRMHGGSYARMQADVPLTANAMRYFVDHYAPEPSMRLDWRASPTLAASHAGLCDAFVLTCGHDPLADEGRDYAARLEAGGATVTALHLSDQGHGFLNMGGVIGAALPALAFAGAALKEAWRHAAE